MKWVSCGRTCLNTDDLFHWTKHVLLIVLQRTTCSPWPGIPLLSYTFLPSQCTAVQRCGMVQDGGMVQKSLSSCATMLGPISGSAQAHASMLQPTPDPVLTHFSQGGTGPRGSWPGEMRPAGPSMSPSPGPKESLLSSASIPGPRHPGKLMPEDSHDTGQGGNLARCSKGFMVLILCILRIPIPKMQGIGLLTPLEWQLGGPGDNR